MIDPVRLRELAAELGYWPATTGPGDIDRHRRLNMALDAASPFERVAKKYSHLHQAHRRRRLDDSSSKTQEGNTNEC